MKMPNAHSAPRGRQTLRMVNGGDDAGVLSRLQALNGATSPTAAPVMPDPAAAHRADFLARNPGVAANQVASPGAPAPVLPKPDTAQAGMPAGALRMGSNSFGDATHQPTSSLPAQTSADGWSLAGRSNGHPIDQQTSGPLPNGVPAPAPLQAPGTNLAFAHDPLAPTNARSFVHMADGGMIGSLRGLFAKETPEQQLARVNAKYAAQDAAAAAHPAAPAPAPVQATTPVPTLSQYGGNGVAAQMKAAGLREGGSLRMADGQSGTVPGTGTGDKIPAKYEPGEFVVSNAMLEAQPALRGQLNHLRTEVLAEKGMTPEDADAKALGGKTVHAVDSLNTPGTDLYPRSQFGVSTNVVPPAAAPNPYNYLGQRAAQALNSPAGKMAAKGASALSNVNALRLGIGAAQDADNGDYAGAVDKGAMGVASTSAAGLPGMAYMAGHAIGEHVINPNLSDETKDDIGSAVNSGVRQVGGVLGQDWGVDDTALRTLRGKPLTPGVNAGAPNPATAPATPAAQDFTAANAAKLAAAGAPEAPASLGDVRNVDPEAGTQDVFTQGAWKTVSTPEAKAARGLRNQQYDAKLASDATAARADSQSQLANLQHLNGTDPESQALAGLGANHRAAAIAQMAATKATLRGQTLSADTALKTTEMNNEASMYGHNMTNRLGVAQMLRDQANKDREYTALRGDKTFEQEQAGTKSFNDHAQSMFQTTDAKGNTVPDTQKAALYTASVTDTIGHLAQKYANSPDPKIRAYAADLSKRGPAALDAADRAVLPMLFERQQLHAQTSGIGPFSSGGAASRNLMDYADKAETNTLGQKRRVLQGGAEIPESNLRYGADANHWLPNLGGGSNYLGAK